MAGSPRYKVFDTDGEYIAACRHAKKFTVWTEGSELERAGDSWDRAGLIIRLRAARLILKQVEKYPARQDWIEKQRAQVEKLQIDAERGGVIVESSA